MADKVRVREITNEEGNRLLRIARRSSGSVEPPKAGSGESPAGWRHLPGGPCTVPTAVVAKLTLPDGQPHRGLKMDGAVPPVLNR